MIRHLNQNEEIKNLGFRIMTDEEISGLDPCTFLNWLNVFESILIVSVFEQYVMFLSMYFVQLRIALWYRSNT
jgi:hypothetical protein